MSYEPAVKLYLPRNCDMSDWIKDSYGNLHLISDGSVWIAYEVYEHGVIYVPEEELPDNLRVPKTFS